MRRRLPTLALAGALALLSGCGTVDGTAEVSFGEIDPGKVAGVPVTDGPSGPKPGVEDATLPVRGAMDDDPNDRLAINALADANAFWTEEMPRSFGQEFQQLDEYVSFDAKGAEEEVCGSSSKGYVNAFYCPSENLVGWDRGVLLPSVRKQFGDMSVVSIFAHEMGHAVQYQLAEQTGVTPDTPTIVKEQQADCFGGAFFRWVVDGNAEHFNMSTGKGINDVLAVTLFVGDEPGAKTWEEAGAHGSAFDRTFALQTGFAEGTKRCAEMDLAEYDRRKTQEPFAEDDVAGGNVQPSTQVLGLLKSSLDRAFRTPEGQAPELVADTGRCPGGASTPPVSYCAKGNTINLDVPELSRFATPQEDGNLARPGADGIGDFAAFAEIASRYAMAVQQRTGIPLDDRMAGLRTTCLTGAWAGYASKRDTGQRGQQLLLSAGDLDEAVAELLLPRSVISADGAGNRVRSGFARVEAFQVGYLNGSQTCTDRFR